MQHIPEKELVKYHEYPILEGKLKQTFILPSHVIHKMHVKMNELYKNSNLRNPVISSQIHKIILDLFIEDYYPFVSRNIKTDNHTIAVIMGGCAFNMNIPNKMNKMLYTQTDDIDMKIYTTDINSLEKQSYKLAKVLSIFKYLIVIICFYMKQIVTEIIEYSRNAFEPNEPYIKKSIKKSIKKTIKKTDNQTIKNNLSIKKTKSKNSKNSKNSKHSNSQYENQDGGFDHIKKSNLIKLKQKRFGVLKSYKVKLQIKNEVNKTKDTIDITDLSYDDTYKLIMSKIDDPDIMITTKISYSFKYINLIVPYNEKSRTSITFSDTKLIYPSIQNPSIFSYYFMNKQNIDMNMTLDILLRQNLNISQIIDTKHCKNNCRFISVRCLQIDLIYMLRFAELLEKEDISQGNIIVEVRTLFKYYKYMIKFIRLHIIKKFFNGTLSNNKSFIDSSRKLIRYVENNLHKQTDDKIEISPINILYKNIISNFHQNFFIKKTMFPEYEALRELVNDYNTTVKSINISCSLFKKLDDEDNDSGSTLDSISIQFGDKKVKDEMSKDMSGGKNTIKNKKHFKNMKTKLVLHDNYSFEDAELDNNFSDKHKTTKLENKIIIDKIHKMLKNEIQFLGKLSQSITK